MFLITQTKINPKVVSDKFLKQCETEAFMKFNSCFLLNLHASKMHISEKTLPRKVYKRAANS